MNKVVLGTMNICYPHSSNKEEGNEEYFNILNYYCNVIGKNNAILDTAYYYGNTKTEAVIGELLPRLPFVPKIATKVNPWFENDFSNGTLGQLARTPLLNQFNTSLKNLNVDSVETLFLHCPDYSTPIEETLETIDYLWRHEKINSWGLSNYSVDQLDTILKLCENNRYEPPNVYQGMYNVICRKVECITTILEDNRMEFWGYNPLAGGLLTGKYHVKNEKSESNRFTNNLIYQNIFWKPPIIDNINIHYPTNKKQALNQAFSWLLNQSLIQKNNNKLILGASTEEQLKENLETINSSVKMNDKELNNLDNIYSKIISDTPNYYY